MVVHGSETGIDLRSDPFILRLGGIENKKFYWKKTGIDLRSDPFILRLGGIDLRSDPFLHWLPGH